MIKNLDTKQIADVSGGKRYTCICYNDSRNISNHFAATSLDTCYRSCCYAPFDRYALFAQPSGKQVSEWQDCYI